MNASAPESRQSALFSTVYFDGFPIVDKRAMNTADAYLIINYKIKYMKATIGFPITKYHLKCI